MGLIVVRGLVGRQGPFHEPASHYMELGAFRRRGVGHGTIDGHKPRLVIDTVSLRVDGVGNEDWQ